jgi:hypothetical protein
MAKGQYDRAAAAEKRKAKILAEALVESNPPIELSQIAVGQFFVYEGCLWFRGRNTAMLGKEIPMYEKIADANAMFVGAGENMVVLAATTPVYRLRLS